MRIYLLLILLTISSNILGSQSCYQSLKQQGDSFLKEEVYEDAIRFYLAALNCTDRPAPDQDKIPDLIKQALQARVDQLNQANAAIGKALSAVKEKQAISDSLYREAETQREKTQAVLDKIYFYENRYGLAYEGGSYGFIDKELNTKINFNYKEALPFDESGFARVTEKSQNFLIDTTGFQYPVVNDLAQINRGTWALDLRDRNLDTVNHKIFDHQSLKILLLSDNQIQELPSQIYKLNQLKSLQIRYNQLKKLPNEIGQLQLLESLNLSFNPLRELPVSIGQLTALKALDLSQNQNLVTLPETIGKLKQLEKLYVTSYAFNHLPATIGELSKLKSLILSCYQLVDLPPEIGQLEALEVLYLGFSQLNKLPTEISGLKKLKLLNVSYNQLESLPDGIQSLTNLGVVYLGNNKFAQFPESLFQLPNLRLLFLGNNEITEIPNNIKEMKKLVGIDLNFNKLNKIPSSIQELTKLEFINLGFNDFKEFPMALLNIDGLQGLSLSVNELKELPKDISRLKELRNLDLSFNQISHLPKEVVQIQFISNLNLANNLLDSLPEFIGELSSLKELDLSENKLVELPASLTQLKFLQQLNLTKNPLSRERVTELRNAMPWCEITWQELDAQTLFAGKNYQAALKTIEKRIEDKPNQYNLYYNLSWYALFAGEPEKAIQAAIKSMDLNPESVSVVTNLALGYLLNNEWSEAEKIYLTWKGKVFPDGGRPCNPIFLQDLQELEAAGILHPDFEKLKTLLKE